MKSRWLYICLLWFAVLLPCASAAVKTKTLLSTWADAMVGCEIDLNSYGTSVRSIQVVTDTFNDSGPDETGPRWQYSSVQINFYESDYGVSAFARAKIEATSITKQSDGRWQAAKIECFQDYSATPIWTGYNCDLGTGPIQLYSEGSHSSSYGYILSSATITYDQLDQSAVGSADATTGYGTTVTATATGGSGTGAYQFQLVPGGSATNGAVTSNGVITAGSPGTVFFRVRRMGDDFYNDSAWSQTYTATFTPLDPNGDNDHDGMPNQWETDHGLNPNDPNDALADPDGDGLTNIAEYNLGSNPQNAASPSNATLPANYTTLAQGNTSKTEAVGTTAGQFSVDPSGAAAYTIPIWVTPGTAGMQPKLTLKYNSRAGSDIAGFGWSLDGLLKVNRLPATQAQDGFVDGINYNDNDRFALDGQRLILISGIYGADGAEYRTEIDSFSRIVSYGQFGSGPARFRVWTKDGLVMDFGNASAGGREDCEEVVAGNAGIRNWHVRRVSDISGNYMDFFYSKDAINGTHLIDRIEYTGNATTGLTSYAKVQFSYEDRADIFKGYVFGTPVRATKRLKEIASYFGSTKVHGYTLAYADLATRNTPLRSILEGVIEFGLNGKAYPPTRFDYTNPQNGWEMSDAITAKWAPPVRTGTNNPGYWHYQQNPATMWADIDGDGRSDLVYAWDSGSPPDLPTKHRSTWLARSSGWIQASGQPGQMDYRINPALDSTYSYYAIRNDYSDHSPSGSSIAGPYSASASNGFVQILDRDGDGIQDVVSSAEQWYCPPWLNIQNTMYPTRLLSVVGSGFIGDGKPCVVTVLENGVTRL